MTENAENASTRLPDHRSVDAVLAQLPDGADEPKLASALSEAFPGFAFSAVKYDDEYWRVERSVLAADGTRIAEYRPWMEAELAKDKGDVCAVWKRLRESDLQISEWHGNSAYAFVPTAPGAADYLQISLGREVEWRAGPIVDATYQPWSVDELLDPSWIKHGDLSDEKVLTGPLYRLTNRAGGSVVHLRSFLGRCARLERAKREASRPDMEQRVWVDADGAQTPFLQAQPDWFEFAPREVRFFQDWEDSSARTARVYEHWALDISDYEHRGEREIGFITRPLRLPAERLEAGDASVHILMDRIEAIDREVGLTFGWFFLMTHGNRVDPDVGEAIARGLREARVRLPDQDARVLLRWADRSYGF
ncbi:MAG: hypothetical protein GY873_09045 [Bosea sp.]|uniref:hypothetical protein n=1 Tax=Bosea sp. (in: a-proteobacteria) TaxID=1871050 RepID=UPI0023878243|nr:hypothetical protein [Bosea sp. (in: a-proteobacteria)]MCP4734326.1 hypothetical protein [Bosea sp. (in: a-proteobacteria)]